MMHPAALSLAALALYHGSLVAAQQSTFPATPLASKHFSYPTGVPYQADTDANLVRGGQFGYNMCNSTTEGQASKCQTSFLNAIDDFCLWAPPEPNSLIADTEGEEVAWCTKPGRGTRLIPAGALQGVQFMKTPDYVQVVGFLDQAQLNMQAADTGGELDPHGADLRGNPLGGLVYSTAWSGNNDTYTQVIEWHNFMGGSAFCFKVCDPSKSNAANFCQHIYDRIGCAYNAPNAAQKDQFLACEGDNQDFPGVFTDASGAVQTYTQPPEAQGAIATMPYQPKVPASSNCVTFTSSNLYTALASVTPTVAVSGGPSASAGASGSAGGSSGAGASGSKGSGSGTGTSGAAGATNTNNSADTLAMSGVVSLMGVIVSVLFFA